MEKWVFEWNWIGGALRNLRSEERKAMIPFVEKAASLLTYVGSEGEPPVVWQGTVGWYRRHLHSWDRGQLMAGGGRGGPVAGKEPDTPAPPGMSGHQPQRRVTGGSSSK